MVDIRIDGKHGTYFVTVSESDSETKHRVQVKDDYARSLTGGKADVKTLLTRSFEFLLEREPKETILPHFDLTAIERFFPGYEAEIKKRLNESNQSASI